MSCAAANATIKLLKESLIENAAAVGEYLLSGIRALADKHPLIGDVRGKGLMIGIELVKDRRTTERAVDERTPLVLSKSQADSVLQVMDQALAEVATP